jgi:hypothetical protein
MVQGDSGNGKKQNQQEAKHRYINMQPARPRSNVSFHF